MESEIPDPVETILILARNGHYKDNPEKVQKDIHLAQYMNRSRYRFGSGNAWYYPDGLFEKAMEIWISRQV
ncbi:MAG: hypothetical protein JW754_04695 [Candidatus Aenigmarchaeota archaeon]|nr:hypothetical protein [Candidatus Aenigmarchaeota archaeon]